VERKQLTANIFLFSAIVDWSQFPTITAIATEMEFLDDSIDPSSQPHHQTEQAASQPLLGEASKLLQRARRTITGRDEELIRFSDTSVGQLREKKFDTVEQLSTAVFEVIVGRLGIYGITSKELNDKKRFWWILPTKYVKCL
jgi:hypothetical protein